MVVGILIACEDDKVFEPEVIVEEVDSGLEVISSSSILADRIEVINEPLEVDVFGGSPAKVGAMPMAPPTQDYDWTYLAQMPVLEDQHGTYYSASFIEFHNNFVYVTYNVQGSTHDGALEIIDVSDPENPVSVNYALFDGIDINQLAIDPTQGSDKVWLAGSSSKLGAVVVEVKVNSSGIISGTHEVIVHFESVFTPDVSANANSVRYAADQPNDDGKYLFVTCGNTVGGLIKLNANTLEYMDHEVYSAAKYVVVDRETPNYKAVTFAAGTSPVIRIHDATTLDYNGPGFPDIPVPYLPDHQNVDPQWEPYGKNAMVLASEISTENRTVFIALGQSGVRAYTVNNGNLVHETISTMLVNGNSNGVNIDADFEFIYMANGADGLAVAPVPKTGSFPRTITPIFTWDTAEEPASANFVSSGHFVPSGGPKVPEYSIIFLAKGLGGVKIIKVEEVLK